MHPSPDRERNARQGDQVRDCLHSTLDRCRPLLGVVFNIVGALHSAAPAHEVAERSRVKHAI